MVPPTNATSLTVSSLPGFPGRPGLVEHPELGCDDVVPVAVGAHLLRVHLDLLAEPLRAGVGGVQAVDVAAHGDALRQVDDGGYVGGIEAGHRLVDDGEDVYLALVAQADLLEGAEVAALAAGHALAQEYGAAGLALGAPEVGLVVRVFRDAQERHDGVLLLLRSGFLSQGGPPGAIRCARFVSRGHARRQARWAVARRSYSAGCWSSRSSGGIERLSTSAGPSTARTACGTPFSIRTVSYGRSRIVRSPTRASTSCSSTV